MGIITRNSQGLGGGQRVVDHDHNNLTILDNTTAPYTIAEKTKLGNLSERFRGVFPNLTAAQTDTPNPASGYYFLNLETNTLWSYTSGSWSDTGIVSSGDMIASIYDPTGIGADVYDRANHTGSQAISTVEGLQTALDSKASSDGLSLSSNANKFLAGQVDDVEMYNDGVIKVVLEDFGTNTEVRVYNISGFSVYRTLYKQAQTTLTHISTTTFNNNASFIMFDVGVLDSGGAQRAELILHARGGATAAAYIYNVYVYRHDSDEVGVSIIPLGKP